MENLQNGDILKFRQYHVYSPWQNFLTCLHLQPARYDFFISIYLFIYFWFFCAPVWFSMQWKFLYKVNNMQFLCMVRVAAGEAWAQLSLTEEKLSKGLSLLYQIPGSILCTALQPGWFKGILKKKTYWKQTLVASEVGRRPTKFVEGCNSTAQLGFSAVTTSVGKNSYD